jgi:peptide chain release factor 1
VLVTNGAAFRHNVTRTRGSAPVRVTLWRRDPPATGCRPPGPGHSAGRPLAVPPATPAAAVAPATPAPLPSTLESVLDRLSGLESEYETVLIQLSDPAVMSDHRRLREVSRRHRELEPVVAAYREYRAVSSDLATAHEMLLNLAAAPAAPPSAAGSPDAAGSATGGAALDAADRAMLRQEIEAAEARLVELDERLKLLLLPVDPNDGKNVIIEIRGAEGGEEANLFARDLYEMYLRYIERKGLRAEGLSTDRSEMGGINQVTFLVKGDGAWSHLKYEGGPHRVQRVPVTEAQGRVHTSSATVTVLPEAEEVDVHIEDKDLKIDVYRSTGPGGQSVNTTDSAVRITHLPTGIVVAMQDEKSQIQNRAKAMQVLRARLLKAEQDRQAAELSSARRSQVGGGGRSEKIRTYNYKENRVTDHRIGLTLYKLDKVLLGELDELVDALRADERTRQLSGAEDEG